MTASDEPRIVSGVQRALLLKTFGGFAALDRGQLAVLASVCRERTFSAGDDLLLPGIPVTAFYLLIEGSVEVLQQGRRLRVFGPRTAVGALAALTRAPEGEHVRALEATLALEVHIEDMEDVFEDQFAIAIGVLGALARTLREMQIAAGGAGGVWPDDRPRHDLKAGRLSLVDKMFCMRQTIRFGRANIEALAELATSAEEVRYRAGDKIWSEGDVTDSSLMILNGRVRCVSGRGEPFEYGAGTTMGGLDAIARLPHWYGAEAIDDVLALRNPTSGLFDVMEDHTHMVLLMMRALALGIRAFMRQAG